MSTVFGRRFSIFGGKPFFDRERRFFFLFFEKRFVLSATLSSLRGGLGFCAGLAFDFDVNVRLTRRLYYKTRVDLVLYPASVERVY